MRSKENKRIASFAVILASVLLFVLWILITESNGGNISGYAVILFSIVPAFGIHAIWRKKTVEKE